MSDFKTWYVLVCVALFAMLVMVMTWLGYLPEERLLRLLAIAEQEQLSGVPPSSLLAQADWLIHARLLRLRSLVFLLGVCAVIGLAEGWACRRKDRLGGLRFSLWVCGTVMLVVMVGLVGCYVLLPQPLAFMQWLPWFLGAYVGFMMFTLAAGLPHLT